MTSYYSNARLACEIDLRQDAYRRYDMQMRDCEIDSARAHGMPESCMPTRIISVMSPFSPASQPGERDVRSLGCEGTDIMSQLNGANTQ